MSPLFKWRPNAQDVAKRMFALAMVYRRYTLEDQEEGTTEEREAQRLEMTAWAKEAHVLDSASRIERDYFFRTPAGSLDPQAKIDAAWRLESLGVLTWSIGLREFLPYDVQFPVFDLGPLFPFGGPPESVKSMIGAARLRPKELIDHERDVAELWNWRSRTARLINQADLRPPGYTTEDLLKIASQAAQAAHERKDIPAIIGDDFPALGKSYRDLNESEYSIMSSIATERHYALNWLCGYSKDWDTVPTST